MICHIDRIDFTYGIDYFIIEWRENKYTMFFNGHYLLQRKTITGIMDEFAIWLPKSFTDEIGYEILH